MQSCSTAPRTLLNVIIPCRASSHINKQDMHQCHRAHLVRAAKPFSPNMSANQTECLRSADARVLLAAILCRCSDASQSLLDTGVDTAGGKKGRSGESIAAVCPALGALGTNAAFIITGRSHNEHLRPFLETCSVCNSWSSCNNLLQPRRSVTPKGHMHT